MTATPIPPPAAFTPQPPARPTSRTGPKVMLIIGIVGLVVALVGVILAVVGGSGVAKLANNSVTLTSTEIEGYPAFTTTPLQANTKYDICTSFDVTADGLVVVKGDGTDPAPYTLTPINSSTNYSLGAVSCQLRYSFDTKEAGAYALAFQTAPTGGMVAVVEHDVISGVAMSAVMLGLGIVLAVFAGIAGLGLTIAGALWLRSRTRNARAMQSPPPPASAPPAVSTP